eukprot:3636215-Rhodomonas_salina.1
MSMQISSADDSRPLTKSTTAAVVDPEPVPSSLQVEAPEEKRPARARASDAHMGLQTFLSPSKSRKAKAEAPNNGPVRRSTRQNKTEAEPAAAQASSPLALHEEGVARSMPRRAAKAVAPAPPPAPLPLAQDQEVSDPDTVDPPPAEVCDAVSATAKEEEKEEVKPTQARRSSTRALRTRKSIKEEEPACTIEPESKVEAPDREPEPE